MKLIFALFISLLVSSVLSAQGNLIFSLPIEYDFKVTITGYNSTKPQTWQTKFENLAAGEHRATILVTRPNSTYQKQETITIKADRGYESTYFIVPLDNGIQCRLANFYTIEQVYGRNNTNNNPSNGNNGTGSSSARVSMYNGKPVLNDNDLSAFVSAAKSRYSSSDKMSFFKSQLPKFYSYTDDIILFLTQFYSESEKLELAKLAYDNVIDKQLYFKLAKSFYSSSYFNELEEYTSKR